MPKLFISHASEDKDDFVRPLAEKLQNFFEVWFDEFELKLGDSLRSSIDAGLHACDFGVVILSNAFFSKKWPVAELNGLFALEQTNRKIILPVWYGVEEADVRAFSPILADRLAASADAGIDEVVQKIRVAVGISERSHEVLVPDIGKQALDTMLEKISGWELDETLLRSEIGAKRFFESCKRIEETVWEQLNSANTPEKPRFARKNTSDELLIFGPYRVSLRVDVREAFANSIRSAQFSAEFFLRTSDFEPARKPQTLSTWLFHPTFVSESEIGFKTAPNSGITSQTVISEAELSPAIVQHLCLAITDRLKELEEQPRHP